MSVLGVRIALLEDNPEQADVVKGWLEQTGYDVHVFLRGADLLRDAGRESHDLYLFDWILPDLDGDEVLRKLRTEKAVSAPVIFVTSRDGEEDVVAALQAGADDYMVKPLRRMELLSRVEAVLRRVLKPASQAQLEQGVYRFDLGARQANLAGAPVVLTEKEYDLALFLFRHLGQLVSRGHLLEAVWGKNADIATRTLDTHMSRLRGKLALRPENGVRLTSVYNFGYRLEALG